MDTLPELPSILFQKYLSKIYAMEELARESGTMDIFEKYLDGIEQKKKTIEYFESNYKKLQINLNENPPVISVADKLLLTLKNYLYQLKAGCQDSKPDWFSRIEELFITSKKQLAVLEYGDDTPETLVDKFYDAASEHSYSKNIEKMERIFMIFDAPVDYKNAMQEIIEVCNQYSYYFQIPRSELEKFKQLTKAVCRNELHEQLKDLIDNLDIFFQDDKSLPCEIQEIKDALMLLLAELHPSVNRSGMLEIERKLLEYQNHLMLPIEIQGYINKLKKQEKNPFFTNCKLIQTRLEQLLPDSFNPVKVQGVRETFQDLIPICDLLVNYKRVNIAGLIQKHCYFFQKNSSLLVGYIETLKKASDPKAVDFEQVHQLFTCTDPVQTVLDNVKLFAYDNWVELFYTFEVIFEMLEKDALNRGQKPDVYVAKKEKIKMLKNYNTNITAILLHTFVEGTRNVSGMRALEEHQKLSYQTAQNEKESSMKHFFLEESRMAGLALKLLSDLNDDLSDFEAMDSQLVCDFTYKELIQLILENLDDFRNLKGRVLLMECKKILNNFQAAMPIDNSEKYYIFGKSMAMVLLSIGLLPNCKMTVVITLEDNADFFSKPEYVPAIKACIHVLNQAGEKKNAALLEAQIQKTNPAPEIQPKKAANQQEAPTLFSRRGKCPLPETKQVSDSTNNLP